MCAFLFGKDKKNPPKDDRFNKPDILQREKQPGNAMDGKIPRKDQDITSSRKSPLEEKRKENQKTVKFSKNAISSEKEANSMIGKGIKIKGELIGQENITIEGYVEGKITLDNALEVGKTGEVVADINAKSVIVAGKVNGNIYTSDKIELLPSANVQGNLFSTKIVISEGANFQGKIDMSGSNKPETIKEKNSTGQISKDSSKTKV